jgi:Pellino, FHA domain
VQCSRTDAKGIRISAAGFDYANEVYLGPGALRWRTGEGGMDGGITAGLYLWKPTGQDGGEWYEVSALGDMYQLRVDGERGAKAAGVDNTLTDGWHVLIRPY